MPILFQYIIKLSVSFAIMYLFYQLILRQLTFYNHNRWYLFGYSVLCFVVAAINISPILEKSEMEGHDILLFFPAIEKLTTPTPTSVLTNPNNWSTWNWLLAIIAAGCLVMLLRLCIQLVSFKRMVKNARLITDEEIRFYQVNKNIIPFSFGNSIFINQHLHTEVELKEIIKHEFVHVKQRHTADIIWAEVLCILNWYNPFAWLIRKAIRQNLEFIADSKVLEKGMDKKRYQYLLLKVIGNNHFSIASQFNFSSLKKRIIMMNKMKTARIHMVKFLFILPLLAILLLSFRSILKSEKATINISPSFLDTIPKGKVVMAEPGMSYSLHRDDGMNDDHRQFFKRNSNVNLLRWKADGGVEVYLKNGRISSYTSADMKKFESVYGKLPKPYGSVEKKIEISKKPYSNPKGYIIDIKDNNGNCMVVIKNKEQKLLRELLLTEWNSNEAYYRNLYGEIPSVKVQPDNSFDGPIESTMNIRNLKNKDSKPLVIVDKVEWPGKLDMNIIDPQKIESLTVLKDAESVKEYGDKGRNGVIIITSKKQTDRKPGAELEIRRIDADMDNMLYYINGQESSKEAVELIDPTKIQSIDVLKGKSAEKKYGEKGKNGVIEITIPITSAINYSEKHVPAPWDIQNVLPGKKKDQC
ncbi:M56 family metallopeptidase [Terrimonas alba]|uniref:M56 family metallopeptidase n=1 Tax=Terrimonas alba TaxID=3349636 RepID=UPI0035F45EB0